MIVIKQLNKRKLQSYIDSTSFKYAPHIAISYHRAVSHISNPRAQDEDILMFIAYEDDRMVGYLGAMPDEIYKENGESYHFAWMSCLWIDPDQRGKKIAQQLVTACLSEWNNHIILTEYTGPAKYLYQKLGVFESWPDLQGRRWYIKSDLFRILPPKKEIFNYSKPLLKAVDTVINTVLQTKYLISKPDQNIRELKEITGDIELYIRRHSSSDGFQRDAEIIRWMLDYPWILKGRTTPDSERYHFSSVAEQFICKVYKIENIAGKMCGIMVVTVRDGHLKVPFLYYDCLEEEVIKALKAIIYLHQVKTMSLYHDALIQNIQEHKSFFSPSKSISRNYLITKEFWAQLSHQSFPLNAGDGDTAFT